MKVNSQCAWRFVAAPSLPSLFSELLFCSFFFSRLPSLLLNRINFSCQSPPSLHHFLITLLSLMSSVMYTGGSGEGPICDFHIRSDQRKLGKIKGWGRWWKKAHSLVQLPAVPLLFFKICISSLCSQERAPHLITAVGGIAALPEPPFWKHPLERRAKSERVPRRVTGREIKENADVYPLEIS